MSNSMSLSAFVAACISVMPALLVAFDGCSEKPIVAQGVAGTPPRRDDPEEPEPHCVLPWRPRPTLDGGAAIHLPCTNRTRLAIARRAPPLTFPDGASL